MLSINSIHGLWTPLSRHEIILLQELHLKVTEIIECKLHVQSRKFTLLITIRVFPLTCSSATRNTEVTNFKQKITIKIGCYF